MSLLTLDQLVSANSIAHGLVALELDPFCGSKGDMFYQGVPVLLLPPPLLSAWKVSAASPPTPPAFSPGLSTTTQQVLYYMLNKQCHL
ncbi:hypothetical protein E2C01_099432 [Portunus trituberculatus]|uniref:Uncharacterized protein n=1 Tax=Portunus trituberculatus TaxID=210409 RepID=A0A5B7KEX2_PORTR|nr:hypothetical protein [Portunus trituberculatus]